MSDNALIFQAFEWYLPADAKHWQRLKGALPELQSVGVSSLWLPPAHKGTGPNDVGYGSYDLFDLGEFEQKGSRPTKYGTVEAYLDLLKALRERGMKSYADVVLNHKSGADESEIFMATPLDPEDRNKRLGEPRNIEGWTKFTFPGRAGQYSEFIWNFQHFTAVDFDQKSGDKAIFLIEGDNSGFSDEVDSEHGNFDYLMNADIDVQNPDVKAELMRWGSWFLERTKVDGLRLDAAKHIDRSFLEEFVTHMQDEAPESLYVFAEYWSGNRNTLCEFLDSVDHDIALFDVPLHFNFYQASQEGENYDLRHIFDGSLTQIRPCNTVTFVDNHDSQPGQALESFVTEKFKLQAYALILLRRDGYPCLFYGDYYGIAGGKGHEEALNPLLKARKNYAYGEEIDNFFDPQAIAWARLGDAEHPHSGLVCLLSNGEAKTCYMELGDLRAGQVFYDITGNCPEIISLNEKGGAEFSCQENSVSVWVEKE